MAFNATQLSDVRQRIAAIAVTQGWTRTQVNAAINAVDDWFETTGRQEATAAIEAAVPGVFTAQQKRWIGKFWMFTRWGVE